jgi:hypothetical protein
MNRSASATVGVALEAAGFGAAFAVEGAVCPVATGTVIMASRRYNPKNRTRDEFETIGAKRMGITFSF